MHLRRLHLWPVMPGELAATLNHEEPRKYLGLDYIFSEFILHVRSAPKFWLYDFFTCMCQLTFHSIWRRARLVLIPQIDKPFGDPKSNGPISLLCPFKILKRFICTCSNQSLSHYSHKTNRLST